MTKWEYKVLNLSGSDNDEMESQLIALGIRGWELVGFSSIAVPLPVKVDSGLTGYASTFVSGHTAVLKRAMRSSEDDKQEPSAPSSNPSPTPLSTS